MLRVKARLVGTSCQLERVGSAWGFRGGGYFVTREKGQGQGRVGKDGIFLEQKERVNWLTCSFVSVV